MPNTRNLVDYFNHLLCAFTLAYNHVLLAKVSMKKQHPLVSVIIPVYNGCPFVAKAIQSIVDQSYKHIELLIVDNGSTDTTPTILQSFQKRFSDRIKIYTFTSNKGAFVASNYALKKAKGRYIAMMDADDVSHKHRIKTQVAYLQKYPQTIVLGTQATIINAKGVVTGKKSMPLDHDAIYKQFGIVHPMVHPSVMINRALLPNPNILYACKYGVNDDYYTFFKLLSHGKFANLSKSLLNYRVHCNNSSLMHLKDHFWTITKIRIEAITKLKYQAPFIAFPMVVMQTMIVSILPEHIVRELFYYFRGIKKVSIHTQVPTIKLFQFRESIVLTRLKSYATNFLA